MRIALVATPDRGPRARELAAAASQAGLEADLVGPPKPAGGGRTAELSTALVAFERSLGADLPQAVVLAGDGDDVLAAALVAVKLGIPLARIDAGARSGGDANGRRNGALADRLADLRLAPGEAEIAALGAEGLAEGTKLATDAPAALDAIAAWLLDASQAPGAPAA